MRVWSYWDGPPSTIHGLCLETARRHHPELVVHTRASAQRMLSDAGARIDLSALRPNHASDVVRWFLLRDHGGLWLDADTIVLRRMDWWTDQLETFDVISSSVWIWRDDRNTGVVSARAGGWVATEMCRRIQAAIDDGTATSRWSSIGPLLLKDVQNRASNARIPTLNLSGELVYPIPFSRSGRPLFHVKRSDADHDAVFHSSAWCYGMTHEIVDGYRAWRRERLITSKRYIGFLLRKGLGL